MQHQPSFFHRTTKRRLRFAGNLFVAVTLFLTGRSAWAQEKKVTTPLGEITTVRHTTINEEQAVSGRTLFSQDRVRTAEQGSVFLNLGQWGQLEIERETIFQLHRADKQVEGTLQQGRIVISLPAKAGMVIKTAGGEVLAQKAQAVVLSIEVGENRLIVASYQGEANLRSQNKLAALHSGEVLSFDGQTQEWTRQLIPRLNQSSRIKTEETSGELPAMTLIGLLFTSLRDSWSSFYSTFQQPAPLFDTTITCRDQNNLPCHVLGGITP